MALVRFALNAEADLASGDEVAQVRADVAECKDSILRRFPSVHRATRKRIPTSVQIQAPPKVGTWVLDFGSPPSGKVWMLVEVIVMADDDNLAPAGAKASLWIGNPGANNNNAVTGLPAWGAVARPATAVPATFVFGGEKYPVHDGENLFAVLYSVATAINIPHGVATVTEFDDDAVLLGRL